MEKNIKEILDSKKEILDNFGKLMIKNCFDNTFSLVKAYRENDIKVQPYKGYADYVKGLNEEEYKLVRGMIKHFLKGFQVNFLQMFEENKEFKIVYEKDKELLDIFDINVAKDDEHIYHVYDNLAMESYFEDGWVDRFSKTIEEDDKE